jgi:hypothetical protein
MKMTKTPLPSLEIARRCVNLPPGIPDVGLVSLEITRRCLNLPPSIADRMAERETADRMAEHETVMRIRRCMHQRHRAMLRGQYHR